MLTSPAGAATVKPTPGVVATEEMILQTIDELSARWHRHASRDDMFSAGMRAGWAQGVGLLLGVPTALVEKALEGGDL